MKEFDKQRKVADAWELFQPCNYFKFSEAMKLTSFPKNGQRNCLKPFRSCFTPTSRCAVFDLQALGTTGASCEAKDADSNEGLEAAEEGRDGQCAS